MEVITIETSAFQQIVNSISELKEVLTRKGNRNPLSETWIDVSETCMLLKISKRTLQTYRDNRILPYSQISAKVYFKVKEKISKNFWNSTMLISPLREGNSFQSKLN